jgi:hypothetical protein
MTEKKTDRTEIMASKTTHELYAIYCGTRSEDMQLIDFARQELESRNFDFEQAGKIDSQRRIEQMMQASEQLLPKSSFPKINTFTFFIMALAIVALFAFIAIQNSSMHWGTMWKSIPALMILAIYAGLNNFIAEQIITLERKQSDLRGDFHKVMQSTQISEEDIRYLENKLKNVSGAAVQLKRMLIGFRILIVLLALAYYFIAFLYPFQTVRLV